MLDKDRVEQIKKYLKGVQANTNSKNSINDIALTVCLLNEVSYNAFIEGIGQDIRGICKLDDTKSALNKGTASKEVCEGILYDILLIHGEVTVNPATSGGSVITGRGVAEIDWDALLGVEKKDSNFLQALYECKAKIHRYKGYLPESMREECEKYGFTNLIGQGKEGSEVLDTLTEILCGLLHDVKDIQTVRGVLCIAVKKRGSRININSSVLNGVNYSDDKLINGYIKKLLRKDSGCKDTPEGIEGILDIIRKIV